MRKPMLVLLVLWVAFLIGCLKSNDPLELYFLRAEEGGGTIYLAKFHDSDYLRNDESVSAWKRGAFTALANQPLGIYGDGAYIAVEDGQAVCLTGQTFGSGQVTMASSTRGCGSVAFLDGGEAYSVELPGEPTALGLADVVRLSPDGTRVLLVRRDAAFNLMLQTCSLSGTDCVIMEPPEGGLLSTANFSPQGNKVVMAVPIEGRRQVMIAEQDGSGARQITHFPDADVLQMQPYGKWIAISVRFGPDDARIATVDPTTQEMRVRVTNGWNTFALE